MIVINISTSLSPRCRSGETTSTAERPILLVYSQGCTLALPVPSGHCQWQLEVSCGSRWIALNLRTEYENAVLPFVKTQPPTVACRLGEARCPVGVGGQLHRRSRSYGTTPRSALLGGLGVVHLVSYRRRRAPRPGGVGRRTGVVHGVVEQ